MSVRPRPARGTLRDQDADGGEEASNTNFRGGDKVNLSIRSIKYYLAAGPRGADVCRADRATRISRRGGKARLVPPRGGRAPYLAAGTERVRAEPGAGTRHRPAGAWAPRRHGQ